MWKAIAWVTIAVVVVGASVVIYGSYRWKNATKEMHATLEAMRSPLVPKVYSIDELADLPLPVQRYFKKVLRDGQPIVSAANIKQEGTFNMGETGDQWSPFVATQKVVVQRPGFDWEGHITMMPGLKVWVHDAYIAGEGLMHASVLGLVSVVNMRDTGEVAKGELMRFLAEAPCYPTVLLPSQGIQWEAVDDTSAKATLTEGENTLTLLFRFGKEDLIESVRAEARGRTVAGEMIPTPWEGYWHSYEMRSGMLIPTAGEVAWLMPEGAKPYWRGRITDVDFEFAN